MYKRSFTITTALTCTLSWMTLGPAQADEWWHDPRVTGDLVFYGGVTEDAFRASPVGSVNVQFSNGIGVHAQGAIGFGEGDASTHFASGFYYRNEMGEIGFFYSHTSFGDNGFQQRPSISTYAFEAEYYLPVVTLGGSIGVQHAHDHFLQDNDELWVSLGASYYANDNLKLSASFARGLELETFNLGFEYAPQAFNANASDGYLLSFTGNVYIPTDGDAGFRIGLRIAGGAECATLIMCDRSGRKNFYGSASGPESVTHFSKFK